MKLTIKLIGIVFLIIAIVRLGVLIQPKSLSPFRYDRSVIETRPLPDGLPAPVARFFRKVYGDRVPLIDSAVISGKAVLRIKGITLPGRYRFIHIAGQGYRHYIEATFFGIPVMKVNEHFLDGRARLELPFGVFEGEQVDQAANLGLWAESMWLPAILINDPRARWEPVDDETALLNVPFEDDYQQLLVRFDPDTGLLRSMEAMRFRDAEGGEKIRWVTEATRWAELDGYLIPDVGEATWVDEGTPWAVFTIEELVYNAGVQTAIRTQGP